MSGRGDIWIEGEKELYMNMQKHLVTLTDNSRRGLRKAGMNIIADAKENLRNNGNIGEGTLRKSGRVQAVEGDPDSIDVGFPMPYAAYVEYGTPGGGNRTIRSMMPRIIQWLRKKTSVRKSIKSAFESAATFSGMSADRYLKQTAYFIARSIVKNGTRPHPFFGPAVEKNMKAIEDAVAQSIREDL